MDESYLRFRFRILKRRSHRLAKRTAIGFEAFNSRYILRRTENLKEVQRFVLVWLAIVSVSLVLLVSQLRGLNNYYLVAGPKPGGTITEGSVGEIAVINPIFPENQSNQAANELVFNGLTRYNGKGQIEPDLAESWQVDETGKIYTVKLRPGVKWQDGQPFTAKDVVYTFTIVQNPNTNSPLNATWRGITMNIPDDLTVQFTLPVPFSPFVDSLTTGILPAHLLQTADPSQLRKIEFNQRPIGTGPFKFKDFSIAKDEARFTANEDYYEGRPQLDDYIIRTYKDHESLRQAYASQQVLAAGGLSMADVKDLEGISDIDIEQIPTTSQSFVFFNTDNPLLSDKKVRQALVSATNTQQIVEQLRSNLLVARSPLLPEHIGFNEKILQRDFNKDEANNLLEQAGWVMGEDGIRRRDGATLTFSITTQDSDFYPDVAAMLQHQWGEVGVQLQVTLVSQEDLQKSVVRSRRYDSLLTAITLGGDPDVYPFWHSSQAHDPGLNLSLYRSSLADQALEAGRTRYDTQLRAAKYEAFTTQWREDSPSVALFRLNYNFGIRESILGVDVQRLVTPPDRYYDVRNWTIKTQLQLQRLLPQSE